MLGHLRSVELRTEREKQLLGRADAGCESGGVYEWGGQGVKGEPHSPSTTKTSKGLARVLARQSYPEVPLPPFRSWKSWGFPSWEPLNYFRGSYIPYAHPMLLVDQTNTVSHINMFQTKIESVVNKIHRLRIHLKWVLGGLL